MNESRRDLVLLHGWGMNAGVWSPLLPDLARRWQVHLAELPGHGTAPWDAADGGLEGWAQAVLADAPERAVWLGWSLGGLVALQAAAMAPERVAALALVAATPRFVQGPDWTHAMPPEVLAEFADALLENPRQTLERFLALQVKGGEEPRLTLRTLRQALARRPEPRREALERGLRLLAESDLREVIEVLEPPLRVLMGGRDTLVPAAVAEEMRRLAPALPVTVVPGAAHAPFLSHPAGSLRWLEGLADG